jgi:predicted CXXCH cytochrome family protein
MSINFFTAMIVFLVALGSRSEPSVFISNQEDCLSCHGALVKNTVVHPELASTCDICHTSTGTKHPEPGVKGFLLSEKLPVLCFNCHTEFQEGFEKSTSAHRPVSDRLSCVNCHNPHSSPEKKLVINSTNELCLKCHNKTIRTDSSVVVNISQVISRAKSVHSPVENGGCVTCHNPHYSEKRALLIGNFPEGQYVKAETDNFELCFMCHDTDLLEAKKTEFGTNFRNGKDNLHNVHIRGDKGRNCTMCHDVHGAANLKLIRDKVKFGSWEMSIKFTEKENGGSCLTACHSVRQYDRTITVEPVSKVFYTIQLSASKERLNMNKYKSISGVREIVSSDGYYRYVYGDYSSVSNAKPDLDKIHKSGFKDAFVKELNISEIK